MKKIVPFIFFLILFCGAPPQSIRFAEAGSLDPLREIAASSSPYVYRHGPREDAISIYHEHDWLVTRLFPTGYIEISRTDGKIPRVLTLPLSFRKHSYPLWIDSDAQQNLYLVVYDVISNSPSGRLLTGIREGLTIYRISKSGDIKELANGISAGGIDTLIYGSITGDIVNICGDNRCYSIYADGAISAWNTEFLRGYEFIEVSFSYGRAGAIVREKYDDRVDGPINAQKANYYVAIFDAQGEKKLEQISAGIPWQIRWKNARVSYNIAHTKGDYLNIFFHDIAKLPFGGVADFGANNLEGRIAWSQAYYLNALISLAQNDAKHLQLVHDIKLVNRIRSEIKFIARLCEISYPGFLVKRYSVDREPILFALHLGRVLTLLERGRNIAQDDYPLNACIKKLRQQLRSLEETVEEFANFKIADDLTSTYLKYRKGYPFWADGANVPYNYVSGYVAGLLARDPHPDDIKLAAELSRAILRLEFDDGFPQTWRYWWGIGDDGWDVGNSISNNTLVYNGNQNSKAHVTYRTMDMQSLVLLAEVNPTSTLETLTESAKRLVQHGMLLPSLNETFVDLGRDPVPLDRYVMHRYARSAAAWELQSQIWALNQLAMLAAE